MVTTRVRWWIHVLALAAIAAAALPHETLVRIIESLAAEAGAHGRYEVSVGLRYGSGGSFQFSAPLSDADADRAVARPEAVKDRAVEAAKRALARKLGYSERLYGQQGYKIVSPVTVDGVDVRDRRSGHTTTIYRGQRHDREGRGE